MFQVRARKKEYGKAIMDRRKFLKTCAALGITVGIPSVVSVNCEPGVQLVELVGYDIDERQLTDAITVGQTKIEDGRAWAECTLDTKRAWQAVTFEDSRGHIWATVDGDRWSYGKHWFEVGRD